MDPELVSNYPKLAKQCKSGPIPPDSCQRDTAFMEMLFYSRLPDWASAWQATLFIIL